MLLLAIAFHYNDLFLLDEDRSMLLNVIVSNDVENAPFHRNISYRESEAYKLSPTRDTSTLDHCCTVLKVTYRSVPRSAIGLSDHSLIHLIPSYWQKLKTSKPVVRTVRKWTEESKLELQSCFDCTDWRIFEAAATNLNELADTVTSYVRFCEDMCADQKLLQRQQQQTTVLSEKNSLSANHSVSVRRGLQQINYRRPTPPAHPTL